MTLIEQGPPDERKSCPSPAARQMNILIANILCSTNNVIRASQILAGKYKASLAHYLFGPNCHTAQVSATEILQERADIEADARPEC